MRTMPRIECRCGAWLWLLFGCFRTFGHGKNTVAKVGGGLRIPLEEECCSNPTRGTAENDGFGPHGRVPRALFLAAAAMGVTTGAAVPMNSTKNSYQPRWSPRCFPELSIARTNNAAGKAPLPPRIVVVGLKSAQYRCWRTPESPRDRLIGSFCRGHRWPFPGHRQTAASVAGRRARWRYRRWRFQQRGCYRSSRRCRRRRGRCP